eukprot:c22017_g1_i1 orf=331-594(+)
MSKSCKGVAMELVKCLSESTCIKGENRSYKECAGEKSPSIPNELICEHAFVVTKVTDSEKLLPFCWISRQSELFVQLQSEGLFVKCM